MVSLLRGNELHPHQKPMLASNGPDLDPFSPFSTTKSNLHDMKLPPNSLTQYSQNTTAVALPNQLASAAMVRSRKDALGNIVPLHASGYATNTCVTGVAPSSHAEQDIPLNYNAIVDAGHETTFKASWSPECEGLLDRYRSLAHLTELPEGGATGHSVNESGFVAAPSEGWLPPLSPSQRTIIGTTDPVRKENNWAGPAPGSTTYSASYLSRMNFPTGPESARAHACAEPPDLSDVLPHGSLRNNAAMVTENSWRGKLGEDQSTSRATYGMGGAIFVAETSKVIPVRTLATALHTAAPSALPPPDFSNDYLTKLRKSAPIEFAAEMLPDRFTSTYASTVGAADGGPAAAHRVSRVSSDPKEVIADRGGVIGGDGTIAGALEALGATTAASAFVKNTLLPPTVDPSPPQQRGGTGTKRVDLEYCSETADEYRAPSVKPYVAQRENPHNTGGGHAHRDIVLVGSVIEAEAVKQAQEGEGLHPHVVRSLAI